MDMRCWMGAVGGLVTLVGLVACNGSSGGSPLNDEQIRPGVIISSSDGSCTGNFIFKAGRSTYYIGTAAHCFSPDTNSGIDACETRNQSLGSSDISIENAERPGTLVYSSWIAMQQRGEVPGSDICQYNDFALVKIHPDDAHRVRAATYGFGGPTAMFEGTAPVGEAVYSYGRSPLHAGLEDLQKKDGEVTAVAGDGWFYRISTDNPGVSGDSGGPVLGGAGEALGVLSDIGVSLGLNFAPITNGVVDLGRALAYAQDNGYVSAQLEVETWPEFTP